MEINTTTSFWTNKKQALCCTSTCVTWIASALWDWDGCIRICSQHSDHSVRSPNYCICNLFPKFVKFWTLLSILSSPGLFNFFKTILEVYCFPRQHCGNRGVFVLFENLNFLLFNDFFITVGSLLMNESGRYSSMSSPFRRENRERSDGQLFFSPNPWPVSFWFIVQTFWFSMTLFFFSLLKCFLTRSHRFCPLRRYCFGGLVVCIADTTEYIVSWSFDVLVISFSNCWRITIGGV